MGAESPGVPQYDPAEQGVQEDVDFTPKNDENVPGGQGFSEPVTEFAGHAKPGAQIRGVVVPPLQLNPAGQGRQEDLPVEF